MEHDFDIKEFSKFLFQEFDKPERLRVFHEVTQRFGVSNIYDYWEVVRELWISSENLFMDQDIISSIFKDRDSDVMWVMDLEERLVLKNFEPTITIYRGCMAGGVCGHSWTTDINVARKFMKSVSDTHKILVSTTVSRDDIIAYIDARYEKEIIIDPKSISEYEILERDDSPVSASLTLYRKIQALGTDKLFGRSRFEGLKQQIEMSLEINPAIVVSLQEHLIAQREQCNRWGLTNRANEYSYLLDHIQHKEREYVK